MAIVPIIALFATLMFPSDAGKLKYVPIYKGITIKANKKLPPHIAFVDIQEDIQTSDWASFEKAPRQNLVAGIPQELNSSPYVVTKKIELPGLLIKKDPQQLLNIETTVYKTVAQAQLETQGPQWLRNVAPTLGQTRVEVTDERQIPLKAARRITGPIEISGGLAVTNEHHIEVRRSDEGVFQEMGRVDLMRGSYSIDIEETSGAIVARLIDRAGGIMGEGSYRLSSILQNPARQLQGPKLEITPNPSWGGRVSRYYDTRKDKGATGSISQVTVFNNETSVESKKGGQVSVDNVARNSTTVARATAPGYMQTNKVLVSGTNFDIPIYPEAMMSSLKSIVLEQGVASQMMEQAPIVWGAVRLDGVPLAGVTVESESFPEAKAIYFNEFMIPDPSLTSTSGNGLYAFTDIPAGFHALLARRGEYYFGHQNIVAEDGAVANGDIENSLRTEAIKVRSYDAFTGNAIPATVHLQSIDEALQVKDVATVVLPQVARMSLIYTEASPEYISANYFYNDTDSFIHLPMIREAWLAEVKSVTQTNDVPEVGTVVGFVPEDEYEVYLAGSEEKKGYTIVYFDAAGRIVPGNKGVSGGGFVIFNVPLGTQEVVVVGSKTERVYSRVLPVDLESYSILNFNSY